MRGVEILGLDGVAAWVTDLERSAAFYALVLGLDEADRRPGRVQFDAGLETITLIDWPAAKGDEPFPDPAPSGPVPVLQVDDLSALRRKLLAVEARFDEDEGEGEDGRSLLFLDPDGHRWRAIELGGPVEPALLAEAEVAEPEAD